MTAIEPGRNPSIPVDARSRCFDRVKLVPQERQGERRKTKCEGKKMALLFMFENRVW